MNKIDLNSDLGEGFGAYNLSDDEAILGLITSANIACGYHAGDALTMEKTVVMAKKYGVGIGAHPGFPDLQGFGRRKMNLSLEEIYVYTKHQIGSLWGFAKSNGVPITHVKPHGAMYNMAAVDIDIALAIGGAIRDIDPDIILMGLSGSKLIEAGKYLGLRVASEVFADRRYLEDGTLMPRSLKGSVIHNPDEALKQVLKMVKDGRVVSNTGVEIDVTADSICVHGDNPSALKLVKTIRHGLLESGVSIVNIGDIV